MNSKHWVVLGAGVVGVSTAWHLHQLGHRVSVVERQPGVALETSFANGGQLSFGHIEPWAGWGTLPKLLKWAFQEDSPILFRLRWDLRQWSWGRQFLSQCRSREREFNYRQLFNLACYSREAHREMESRTGIQYQAHWSGILHLHQQHSDQEEDQQTARLLSSWGYPRNALSLEEARALEPALRHSQEPWLGASYVPGDGSGNAQLWTEALARECREGGVEFLLGHEVRALDWSAGAVQGVHLAGEVSHLKADGVVVCMGCGSVPLLKPLGLSLPIYPVKGYSATFPIKNPEAAPTISITDSHSKTVLTRLGNQLRIAGTAEFAGEDNALNLARAQVLTRRARQLFPEAAYYDQVEYWSGLRPATPSNRPILGRVGNSNLLLNTGHGTLGWTLSSGSAKAVAELASGLTPALDYSFSVGR